MFSHCSISDTNSTWDLGAVALYFFLMRVLKDCDSSTALTFISNMIVVCGMDMVLVWMILSHASFTSSLEIEYVFVVIDYSISKMIFLIDLTWWYEVVKFLFQGSLLTPSPCFILPSVCLQQIMLTMVDK